METQNQTPPAPPTLEQQIADLKTTMGSLETKFDAGRVDDMNTHVGNYAALGKRIAALEDRFVKLEELLQKHGMQRLSTTEPEQKQGW